MKKFEYIDAATFESAAESLKFYERAEPLAGGTDLIGELKAQILPECPQALVNLKNIKDSAYIRDDGDSVSFGALTKLCDIADSDLVKKDAKAVHEAARSVATPIIRHSATIGGNICQDVRCWYYRYPNSVGGRIDCARKGGGHCYAVRGRNQYHSVMGGMKVRPSACSAECPAGIDIPAYMSRIREGDWNAAAEIIMRVNPMPMLTARICPHTCQTECGQNNYGDGVAIHAVERALGDYIAADYPKYFKPPVKETGRKAAIVGGGPAGLTAAYYLRREGHTVVVYDKMPEAGGVMMYGIPEYRLPKHYVQSFVKAVAGMGVKFILNTEVGRDITMERIREANDTVFLDTGAWKQPILGFDGEHLTQFGLNFLVEVKQFMSRQIEKEIVVCGGGSVATDVALTAVRLGAQKVKLVCLEQRNEMPATPEELARAEEEGVEIHNGWGLGKVLTSRDGKVSGLEVKRCKSVFDADGHFSPAYDEGDKKALPADCVILATGQKVDIDFLGERYREELKSARGLIEVDEHKNTRAPGVYAGGDAASGPSVAIKAVRDGCIAARNMSAHMGYQLPASAPDDGFLTYNADLVKNTKRAEERDTPLAERTLSKEDSESLSRADAAAEAGRCMNCACYSVNASDISPVLVAQGAVIRTTGREFSAEDFFRAYDTRENLEKGELVREIRVPKLPGYRCGYLKMRLRESIDFAVTSLAYAYKEEDGVIKDARVAAGGVAPVPVRLKNVEKYLVGKKKTQEVIDAAAELARADASPMEENTFKIQELKVQLKKSLTGA